MFITMKHFFLPALILAVLTACQTPPPPQAVALNAVNGYFIDDRLEQSKNYKLNTLQTVYVGQPVVKRKSYQVKIKSELVGIPQMDITLHAPRLVLNLAQGKAYPIKYEVSDQGRIYQILETYDQVHDHYFGVLTGDHGEVHHRVLDGNVWVPDMFEISPINGAVLQQRVESEIGRKNTENFEIVFGGMNNNQINLTYREFTPGDVAKTAFYQDLTYPLSSQTIRYQNLKIQVHEITPEHLSYMVVAE